MIPLQLLSRVLLEHLVTKIFGKPGRAILTTFQNSQISVTTSWSGDDLKIVIKKIRGQVSGGKPPAKKQIWMPGEPGGLVKPKRIISSAGR